MEQTLTTVKGYEGKPIRYNLTGMSDDEEEEKEEKEIPPPPPKQKKNKKKDKKKKKEKKRKPENVFFYTILPPISMLVFLILFFYYIQCSNDISIPKRELLELNPFGFNTTSETLNDYHKLPKMKSLLKSYSGTKLKPLICLHHIKTNMTGRVCLFKKHYLIVNPMVKGIGTDIIDTKESSVACKEEVAKRRWKKVQVLWEDDMGHVLSSKFSNGDAAMFQLMMDEFEGKC
jgi:hypothetical protein